MRLVLLPGLDGTGVPFEPLIRALREGFDPIVCTYPVNECRSYDDLVPEVMRRLPRDEPFVLLGESYGGPLSLMVAARRPPGLAGLILSASFVSCPYPFVPKWASHLVLASPFKLAPALARAKSRIEGVASPELSALISRALGAVKPAVLASRIREVIQVQVEADLLACQAPILYIQGSHDVVVPAGNLTRIQALRPDVRAVRLVAPHMVLQVAAMDAARAIEAFADEQAQA